MFTREWRFLEEPERAAFRAERRRYEERWHELLRDAADRGALRADLDVDAAVLLVLSAANWAYTWLRAGSDTDALADRFFAILVDGVRGYAPARPTNEPPPDRQPAGERGDRRARRAGPGRAPAGTEVVRTGGPASDGDRARARGVVDAIYVFSGDGTYNEVLNGVGGDIPLGFIPGGGTSVLPRALGPRAIP